MSADCGDGVCVSVDPCEGVCRYPLVEKSLERRVEELERRVRTLENRLLPQGTGPVKQYGE